MEINKVGVFVKPTEVQVDSLERVVNTIENAGCKVYLEERAAQVLSMRHVVRGYSRKELGSRCDVAVVLGGDGTMLGVARTIAEFHKPIIGINAGRLGFITDVVLDDVEEVLPEMLHGSYISDRRYLLEGTLIRDGRPIFTSLAGNDIGYSHGRAGGMVDFTVYVDGQQICSQSADGVICSTAMGSTAYALAAGGPILHPSLDAMLLVPVAPHTISNRPIVLPAKSVIEIKLIGARDAVSYFDMQEFFDVAADDILSIKQSDFKIEILHPNKYDYFEILRKKLHWNISLIK